MSHVLTLAYSEFDVLYQYHLNTMELEIDEINGNDPMYKRRSQTQTQTPPEPRLTWTDSIHDPE
jgi:hypothetical protein